MRDVLMAQSRELTGKNSVKKVRRDGFVPAVVYGHNKATRSIKVEKKNMDRHFSYHGKGSTLELNLEGERIFALIKNYQIDTLKDMLIHVDFQELSAGEKVKVKLPLKFIHKDLVEDSEIVVAEQVHELELITLPKDLIDVIEVDVKSLKSGEPIYLKDLDVYKEGKFTFMDEADLIIVTTTKAGHVEKAEEEVEEPDLLASL